jgi:integrase
MARPRTPIGSYGAMSFREATRGGLKLVTATAHYRDSDGKTRRITASGRTRAIAQTHLIKKLDERASYTGGTMVKPTTTIGELASLYGSSISSDSRLKAQTRSRYLASANGTIARSLGDVRVSELTAGMVERFLMGLANSGRVSEARNSRVVLRAMMRLALSDDAVRQNPVQAADVRLPKPVKPARAMRSDEVALLRHLVASYRVDGHVYGPRPSPDLLDALHLMLGAGLRISEVLALRTEHVVLLPSNATKLIVSGTVVYENGRGAYRQESTKSGKVRTLLVPSWIADLLADRVERSISGFLWETRSGRPYQQSNLLRTLRSILRGTELEWVTSHTLRKTAGTHFAKTHGVSVATSALGHSSDEITRRIYIDETDAPTDVREPDSL